MITWRAIIIGAICSFLIGAGEPFTVLHIWASPLCADYSTGGAVFLFFILVFLINTLLKKISVRFSLKPPELITVYIMMIVACAIPSWGFTMNLIGLLGGIFYYATPVNRWEEFVHPYLPKHLFPQNKEAIWAVYEGLPKGAKIPWGAWIAPLTNWFLFIIAFYFLSICLMVILRKQWVEKERLTYPLTELPAAMVNEERPLYRNKLMWIGFLIPFILYGLKGLNKFFPSVPAPIFYFSFPIFNRAFSITLRIFFEVIGLAYFMSLSVLFSVWFFALVFIIETGFLNRIGFSIGPTQPFSDPAPQIVALQSLGALIVLSISCIWFARKHLKEVFLRAIGKKTSENDDREEILSYKTSFWGFVIAFLFVVWWINKTGLSLLPAIFFTIMTLLIFLGLTRIISQAGLAYYRAPVIPAVPTLDLFGSQRLGPPGLTALGMTFSWATDIRTLVMTSTANGLKLATLFKINCRRLFFGIMVAIIISLISSAWMTLLLGYKYGGINFSSWHFTGLANFAMKWATNFIRYPVEFGKAQFGFLTLGSFLMFLLILARNHFLWWPLSPVGLAIGLSFPVYQTWFSVFIAWLIKAIVMKYGGIKVYNTTKPFFLGLILGAFVTAGIWAIIGFFTKMDGLIFTLT
ncbi:MAG: OPT/YSL family transporter [Candidatus Omnitrophica bacterium]|nr:OPT/YSL family transporter [Candidatus Omnitrophota bacterium]